MNRSSVKGHMPKLLRNLFRQQGKHNQPSAQENNSRPDIAFQGSIEVLPVEDLFQLFDFAGLTGKLEIHNNTNTGTFYFRNGVLLFGVLKMHSRRIGQILLETGLITKEQLEHCLHEHQENPQAKRFGQILTEKGFIASEQLDQSLIQQVKEAFFETLSWQEGRFEFYQDQLPSPEEIHLYARIDHLLLEGVVHIDHTSDEQEDLLTKGLDIL